MRWGLVALVVGGAILRLRVAQEDLFADELATYWVVSTRGLGGVVRTVSTTAEISPPLSFVLSWFTTRIGLSPELVRLPALVAGVATIPLVYAVGVRTVGRGAALLAAALTTLSPFMVFYSAEARGYAVAMALVLLSTLGLLLAVEDGRRRWWVLYGAAVCLAAYTHYTVVFVLAAQLAWAMWVHPRSRRGLALATAAAVVVYLPWLPSLKGDLDSPTTKILSLLSPFDLGAVRKSLGHWSLGYPFAVRGTALRDVPGAPGLLLLLASICVGAFGIYRMRSRLGAWFGARQWRIVLVVLLAVATPAGAALQSAVGDNVFSTRTLAASWPYLALAGAALVTVGPTTQRVAASVLAIAAFSVSATKMTFSDDVQRPEFSRLAHMAERLPGGVVVDGASLTPGPLTNFDIEGSEPGVEVFRLTIPDKKTSPFAYGDPLPDPTDVSRRAATAADGGPITVMTTVPTPAAVLEFVDELPGGYALTDTVTIRGIYVVQALVYQRDATP